MFRGLLLSEFSKRPLREVYYKANDFSGHHIADPFMGGGTPILEANRVGCDVTGFDINPMSYWIVKQEIEHLNLDDYSEAARLLRSTLEKEIGHLYRTRCTFCGSRDAHVKYFLWVKVIPCEKCGKEIDLFPGYLLSTDSRHPQNVFVCSACGELTETKDRKKPGRCSHCSFELKVDGSAKRGRCKCSECGADNRFPDSNLGAPTHRLFAMEYHCPECKSSHKGRFFKKPDDRVRNALATNLSDLLRYQNMLCRYDKRALKSLDIFSIHGFPVGLIQCESNFFGIMAPGRAMCVGSGGWANIIEKFKKAKSYCDHPFEVRF